MSRQPTQRRTGTSKARPSPARFAPSTFVASSPEAVQRLCNELATEAARAFAARGKTDFRTVGTSIAQQLRVSGHDLSPFDETEDVQQWQATLYHPKGTFSLFLSFRANGHVEVTFRSDTTVYTARA